MKIDLGIVSHIVVKVVDIFGGESVANKWHLPIVGSVGFSTGFCVVQATFLTSSQATHPPRLLHPQIPWLWPSLGIQFCCCHSQPHSAPEQHDCHLLSIQVLAPIKRGVYDHPMYCNGCVSSHQTIFLLKSFAELSLSKNIRPVCLSLNCPPFLSRGTSVRAALAGLVHRCGLQCMEVKSESASSIWLSATLWAAARQAFLPMGFSRQEYWSGLPLPPPGFLPGPGVEPRSPALAGRFFTVWATREARPLWSLSERHFGLSGGVFLGPRRFTSVPAHIHTHSLSRSQGEQMLSSYLVFLLWYQLNCLLISSSLLLLFLSIFVIMAIVWPVR